MQFKFVFSLLAYAVATQAIAAKPIFNNGGLGCGEIVSLRESTQKPIQSEVRDEFDVPRSGGNLFLQVLSIVPGVSAAAAIASDVTANAAISVVGSNAHNAEKAKQEESAKYKDVMAVEFRFDDGEVINIPVFVANVMRYKVGARLNAMISPKYGQPVLGTNPMFAGVPKVGDSDYNVACRIDDAQAREKALEPLKSLVDEDRIVNAKERRPAATSLSKTDDAPVIEATK